MQLLNGNFSWKILYLLLLGLPCIQCHMLHYMHLKKFITAVAFARALGKRPTVLPIPIPIPIPIAQNEVIKLPMGGNGAKTTVIDGSKGSSQADTIAQLLGGIPNYASSLPGFASNNKFSFAQLPSNNKLSFAQFPSSNNPSVINLSQLQASDSNLVNSLATALSNGGQTKVLILNGGQNPKGSFSTSPSVIRIPVSNMNSHGHNLGGINLNGHNHGGMGPERQNLGGINPHGLNLGGFNQNGLNLGGFNQYGQNMGGLTGGIDQGMNGLSYSDLGLGSSLTNVAQLQQNERQPTQHGRNMHVGIGNTDNSGNSKLCVNCHRQQNQRSRSGQANFQNAPLSVKFTYRP
ncbi:hypothetical protein JTE90_001604 [Oedothorax gibbosus]|uniref:Uncharacterized protein n=1 Tax=Oedothorax gibbosus TaxID=931172 RepID=A0AAV6VP75_9ARAC|nr:hypothetical protein JTE90_001604 [Oedothorax gibbosus]